MPDYVSTSITPAYGVFNIWSDIWKAIGWRYSVETWSGISGPRRFDSGCVPTRWAKAVHNVSGLACILRLTGPNNQVSLTTKERSTQGMADPHKLSEVTTCTDKLSKWLWLYLPSTPHCTRAALSHLSNPSPQLIRLQMQIESEAR